MLDTFFCPDSLIIYMLHDTLVLNKVKEQYYIYIASNNSIIDFCEISFCKIAGEQLKREDLLQLAVRVLQFKIGWLLRVASGGTQQWGTAVQETAMVSWKQTGTGSSLYNVIKICSWGTTLGASSMAAGFQTPHSQMDQALI